MPLREARDRSSLRRMLALELRMFMKQVASQQHTNCLIIDKLVTLWSYRRLGCTVDHNTIWIKYRAWSPIRSVLLLIFTTPLNIYFLELVAFGTMKEM